MRGWRRLSVLVVVAAAWRALPAQTIPVRTLTTPVATDSGMFITNVTVRPLSDGSAIVNDQLGLRLYLFDAQFRARIIADTSGTAPNRYPASQTNIIPYLGDTTLLSDRDARAFILVDQAGRFVRSMAPPIPSDFNLLGSSPGNAATDPRGRLTYRVTRRAAPGAAPPRPDSGKVNVQTIRDSAVIVRANFDTRTVDWVALLGMPVRKNVSVSMGSMGSMAAGAVNPLPASDDWAVLADGTIALVRVGDYHIDFVGMDGKVVSAPKMAFDWKRVTDEDKQRMLDSVKVRYDLARARLEVSPSFLQRRPGGGVSISSYGDGLTVIGGADGKQHIAPFVAVELSEMPDYYPPIRAGTVKADLDGNLWVLPTTSTLASNGLVYDVINGKGEIIERVKLPPDRRLAAVGKGGVVYMSNVLHGYRLERATIVR